MTQVVYHGRHRPQRSSRRRHAALVCGLALPTAVTLAAVTTSGSATTPMELVGLSSSSDVVSALALQAVDSSIPGEPLERMQQERADRNSERARAETVTAESARRAETEAALAAAERVIDVTSVPASGGSTEGAAAAPNAQTAAAASAAAGSKAWIKPLNSAYRMTSGFGMRWGNLHPAQDFATPVGTPVLSLSSGTVIFAGWQGGYGNKLEIQFWDGTVAWFAHNSALKVSVGQSVTPGQVIAASGNTGHSTGPHVHLEIHPGGGDPVPPLPWLASHGIPM